MGKSYVDIPRAEIEAFCKKYNIKELSLFGSVLSDDFNNGMRVKSSFGLCL